MKKVEISQVILLHPIKFVCDAFTKFAKDLSVEVYTLDAYEQMDYLLNDLKPDVLIVHTNILTGFSEQIKKDLSTYNENIKVIIWGTQQDIDESDFTYNKALVEPVDLGQMNNIFESLLAEVQ